MSARIVMHPFFAEHIGRNQAVNMVGKDVGECLASLAKQYPPLRKLCLIKMAA